MLPWQVEQTCEGLTDVRPVTASLLAITDGWSDRKRMCGSCTNRTLSGRRCTRCQLMASTNGSRNVISLSWVSPTLSSDPTTRWQKEQSWTGGTPAVPEVVTVRWQNVQSRPRPDSWEPSGAIRAAPLISRRTSVPACTVCGNAIGCTGGSSKPKTGRGRLSHAVRMKTRIATATPVTARPPRPIIGTRTFTQVGRPLLDDGGSVGAVLNRLSFSRFDQRCLAERLLVGPENYRYRAG